MFTTEIAAQPKRNRNSDYPPQRRKDRTVPKKRVKIACNIRYLSPPNLAVLCALARRTSESEGF